MIVQLSEGDACLRIGRATIPDEFYMVLGENEIVLACTVDERSGDMVEVRFTSRLDGKLVNQLARLATPFATLGPILKEGGCLAAPSNRTENTPEEAPDTNG